MKKHDLCAPGLVALLLVFATAAAFLAVPPRQANAADGSVSIANFAFSPASITVNAGESVTWTDNQSGVTHTVSSDTPGVMDSGPLSAGGTFSMTFPTAGTVAYHCNIHSSMHGTVTVLGAELPTATPTEPPAAPTNTPIPPTSAAATPTVTSTAAPTTAGSPAATQPTAAASGTPAASASTTEVAVGTAPAGTPGASPSATRSAIIVGAGSPAVLAPATGADSDDSGGGSAPPLLLGLAVVVLALAGGGFFVIQRRRQP